jgi:predicted MPP superfamily phosphohydrolase
VAGLGASAVAGSTGVIAAASALSRVAVKRVSVPLASLPAAAEGYRIVQLTDVHIGPMLGRAWLDEVVRNVNALSPDIVVITGDLVDGSVAELQEHVQPLAALKSKHGVFFVTGNHEYISGVEEWVTFLPSLGIRVLENERVTIGEGDDAFELAGVYDFSAARFRSRRVPDLAGALRGWTGDTALVLLAHQPKHAREAAARGVGLVLSGHTHGGQIWPFNWLVKLQQPYVAGLHRHRGTWIYVSCGTGFWGPPMRLAAPSELTHVVLRSGSAAKA